MTGTDRRQPPGARIQVYLLRCARRYALGDVARWFVPTGRGGCVSRVGEARVRARVQVRGACRWPECVPLLQLGDHAAPHIQRFTAVWKLVPLWVPERVAMKLTGHKTRSVFERYNIVSDGDLGDAARKLDRGRSAKRTNVVAAGTTTTPIH